MNVKYSLNEEDIQNITMMAVKRIMNEAKKRKKCVGDKCKYKRKKIDRCEHMGGYGENSMLPYIPYNPRTDEATSMQRRRIKRAKKQKKQMDESIDRAVSKAMRNLL